jgi:hypothetical protein
MKLLFFFWILVLATGCNDVANENVANDNIVSNVSLKKWYSSAPKLSVGSKINFCDSIRKSDDFNPYNVDGGEIKNIGLVAVNNYNLVLYSRVKSTNKEEILKTPSLNAVVFDKDWHKTDSVEIKEVDLFSYTGTDSWNCPFVRVLDNKVRFIRNEGFNSDQWIDSLELTVGQKGNLQLARFKSKI